MKSYCQRMPSNDFERQVQQVLDCCKLDGAFTNNIIIPDVKFRWLPNELDFLLLQPGHIYVIDAKELDPGFYRGPHDGQWEYSTDGVQYHNLTNLAHPWDIAFKKARVVEHFIRALNKDPNKTALAKMPHVVSVIVVPDHADVSGLGWKEDGQTDTGVRFLLSRLSSLAEVIGRDSAGFPRKEPTIEQMAELLHIQAPNEAKTLPCRLDEHLEIVEEIPSNNRPILRSVYRGFRHFQGIHTPVRVEIIRKLDTPVAARESFERNSRALRTFMRSYEKLNHSTMLRLVSAPLERPSVFILVNELFSQTSLHDLIRERRLSWDEARRFFAPVVDLLRQAHAVGVVHRYLDPSCILVNPQTLETRVQGFYGALVAGCSCISSRDMAGDPYVASEFDTVQEAQAQWLDVFSLGRCITYSIMGDPLKPLRSPLVPEAVVDTVAQLMAILPQQRASAWEQVPRLLVS